MLLHLTHQQLLAATLISTRVPAIAGVATARPRLPGMRSAATRLRPSATVGVYYFDGWTGCTFRHSRKTLIHSVTALRKKRSQAVYLFGAYGLLDMGPARHS